MAIPASKWRLRHMMAEREIRSGAQLQRLLHDAGYDVSMAQVSRLIAERPRRYSAELLDALMLVLECSANDLIQATWAHEDAMGMETPKPKRPTAVVVGLPGSGER